MLVSTHSRPKAAAHYPGGEQHLDVFQLTAARRRLLSLLPFQASVVSVSTHSRPKAAATGIFWLPDNQPRFNSQPPEGGCDRNERDLRRLEEVSTHSRSKAAAIFQPTAGRGECSFNSQPLEGGCTVAYHNHVPPSVSTHSRSKAAADADTQPRYFWRVSTHSRSKAAASPSCTL